MTLSHLIKLLIRSDLRLLSDKEKKNMSDLIAVV